MDTLRAKGITSLADIQKFLLQAFGRQTTQRLMFELTRNRGQFFDERGRIKQGFGVDAANDIQNNESYAQVEHNYEAAKQDMLMKIGEPVMQMAIPVLKQITAFFDKVGELARTNPDTIKKYAEYIGALGVALVGGGVVAIAAALGPTGWLVGGLLALGAVIAKNPDAGDQIKKMFDETGRAFDIFIFKLRGFIDELKKIIDYWNPFKLFGGGGDTAGGGGSSYSDSAARMRRMSGMPAYHTFTENSGVGGTGTGGTGSFGLSGPHGNTVYDAIIRAEGTGKHGDPYNTSLGYMTPPKPLTSMTMAESLAWGDRVRAAQGMNSSAKGAFQIVNSTQRAAMKALHFGAGDLFNEDNQKRMADWILQHQGAGAWEGFKSHPSELNNLRKGFKPYHESHRPIHIAVTQTLDGEVVHRSVIKREVARNIFPRSAPFHDGMRMWTSPDAGLQTS